MGHHGLTSELRDPIKTWTCLLKTRKFQGSERTSDIRPHWCPSYPHVLAVTWKLTSPFWLNVVGERTQKQFSSDNSRISYKFSGSQGV